MKGASGSELRVRGGEGERVEWVKSGGMGRSRRDLTPVDGVLRTPDPPARRGEKGGEDGEVGGGGEEEEGGGKGVGGRFEGGGWMMAAVTLGSLDST